MSNTIWSQTGSKCAKNPTMSQAKFTSKSMQHIFANTSFCSYKPSKLSFQCKYTAYLSLECLSDSVKFKLLQGGRVIWLPHLNFIFIAPWNWGFLHGMQNNGKDLFAMAIWKNVKCNGQQYAPKESSEGQRALHKSSWIPFLRGK